MTDPLEGLAVVGSRALRRTTLATLYNGPTVQREKNSKNNTAPGDARRQPEQRSASRAASGRRSDEGHVWAGIYGFDSVLDGRGRFALDRADLRQICARFAPIYA